MKVFRATTRKRPQYLEAIEQRLFIRRYRLDARTRDVPACAVPNGGKRSAREAALLKAEGVEAGVPDWLCFAPGTDGRSIGLALEFKSPTGKGRLSDNQKRWAELLRKVGWRVEIVTTAKDAWSVVTSHLGIENG
jgi:hypothetical protein